MQILLIEDNPSIIKGLEYSFNINNYTLIAKTNIHDAKEYIKNNAIDLIILDITLPDGNGLNLYEDTIKYLQIPTIFLTASDEEDNIVKALDNGAEDYLTKPFSTKELLARINKILRHYHKNNLIKVQNIVFDMEKLILTKDNQVIELTALELKIINLLFTNINKVVTRNIILDKIWEWTGNYVDDHTITVYLNRIRDKIGSNIITTIKGIGYRIDEK